MNSKYKMTSHDLNMAPETHAVRDERKNNSAYLVCKPFTPNITYGCGGAISGSAHPIWATTMVLRPQPSQP